MRQTLLQNVTAILLQNERKFTTKCDGFITKCDSCYKMRCLLQNASGQGLLC